MYGRGYDAEEELPSSMQPGLQVYHETPRESWDCESVLSLRSNLDNHPALLGEAQKPWIRAERKTGQIRLSAKTGAPVLGDRGKGAGERESQAKRELQLGGGREGGSGGKGRGEEQGSSSDGEDQEGRSVASSVSRRGESAEEKKERKARVKEEQVREGTFLFKESFV